MAANRPLAELFDLRGHVALVTGAGRGIGQAIALRLAEAGAKVVVSDLDESAAKATVAKVPRSKGSAEALALDVADPAAGRRAVEALWARHGAVDILVNNAGIFPFSPALDTSPELWNRVLGVNLTGAFFLAQSVARRLAGERHEGSIVNIASVDSIRPTGALAHYDASKGGLAMLTRSLALEFAPSKIRVNAIAPGAIDTPGARSALGGGSAAQTAEATKAFLARIPLQRMGDPDEIALAALYLASPLSTYVTGSLLVVDGGYLVA